MKRPTLALCMIVKNEENNLPRLLNNIAGCFDEIHITDTGSNDRTLEILKDYQKLPYGLKVHHFNWVNDFGVARNYSFSHAKADYIMWIDADDSLENKDKFLEFRDNAMELADYWIAKYDYTTDPITGKALCSFARERIIKRSKEMSWRYPIHEGITPDSKFGPVRVNYISTWHVKHVRTEEDLAKDRARNLGIFERIKDKLDPRMRYYYGKELFECGKPVEAAHQLCQAISEKDLETHDRVLGIQYACYSYMACSQFEKVIELAHQGLSLMPNRAEFHCILGDAYLKAQRLVEAIPSYSAAKSCTMLGSTAVATPIFHHEAMYGSYPRNQLARIYANLGDFDRAYLEAKECIEKHPENDEARAIQGDLVRIKTSSVAYKNAKPCDDIVISCPPGGAYLWDSDVAKEKSMGGSETAAIEMAHHLKKLSGRPIKIFNPRDQDKVCDSVEYISTNKLTNYMAEHKPYLHIAWRHNIKITDAPTFIWSHDLFTQGMEFTEHYNKIMALTPFHKRYLMAQHGLPENKIYLTRNGIKPERFKNDPVKKNPNKVIFPNSPDRGLDRVMRVLDKVRHKHTDLELHVFYGIEHLSKYPQHQKLCEELKIMFKERPWVKYHGATQQDELMRHFREAALWVYPSDWLETSCISAVEVVGNGVYPIVRRIGGIVDTLSEAEKNGMASIIDSDCMTESEYDLYAQAVTKAIDEKAWERVKLDVSGLSWENVAKQWLEDLPKLSKE